MITLPEDSFVNTKISSPNIFINPEAHASLQFLRRLSSDEDELGEEEDGLIEDEVIEDEQNELLRHQAPVNEEMNEIEENSPDPLIPDPDIAQGNNFASPPKFTSVASCPFGVGYGRGAQKAMLVRIV